MALSKPAMMSAFLCPGVGQWVAGRRVLGALLVILAIVSAGSPFARFIWALFQPYDCTGLLTADGGVVSRVLSCSGAEIGEAFRATARVAAIGFPTFALVWVGSVLHASRLTIGGTSRGASAPPPPAKT